MSKEIEIIQNNELMKSQVMDSLVSYAPEHKEMLQVIKESSPEIQRATSLFNKRQSQFMDNMLTVSHPTPLRNLRQILSEMSRTRQAIKEQHFEIKKKEIEIKMKERDLENEEDPLQKELLDVEIFELYSQIENSKGYLSGAIRKLTNYTEQYNTILEATGAENFNEIDFEKEEEKYHIMKAFEQGLNAARSRNGVIDEGNMIYFTQIGINGGSAQREVAKYLGEEGKIMHQGQEPSYDMYLDFLNRMVQKYQGCSIKKAESKGMKSILTEKAALKHGDLRLIEEKRNASS